MEFWHWTWVFMMICLINNSVQGRITSRELSDITIKTIQSDDGDVIHCIDIYKQPAFNHPLLENHTIEMVPSFYSEERNRSSEEKIFQTWQKNGSCPEGTIPILNIRNKQKNSTFMSLNVLPRNGRLEVASYFAIREEYYRGVKGRFLVCSPSLIEWNDYTSAALVLESRNNAVQFGWTVHPRYFGNYDTRLYVVWTSAQERREILNLDSPGFVHTSRHLALGASLLHSNGNTLYEFKLKKDRGKWWAVLANEPIGYWPVSVFNDLSRVETVGWSGMVFNSDPRGPHTSTQMGNGVHPQLGPSSSDGPAPAAAFVDDLGVMTTSSPAFSAPPAAIDMISFPRCYSAVLMQHGRTNINVGMTMYYGGTGTNGCDDSDY